MKKKPSFARSFIAGLAVVAAIIVLAYGFQVTKVNFKETQSEQRLTQLTRIIRALAHPKILEYDKEEVFIEAPIYLPCPEGDVSIPEPDTSGPYLILDPPCNDAEQSIVVYGHNFMPGSKGPINFMPPSGVSLTLGNFETDAEGYFEENVKLPNRQPVAEAQIIRAIARTTVGLPRFSPIAKLTWAKIIETVFLALLATTFGTLLAIPISFLAARNLMSDVKSPVASVALTIIGWMVGIAIGLQAVQWIGQWRDIFLSSLVLNVVGLIVFPSVGWGLIKWALPAEESRQPGVGVRLARILALIVAALSIILATYLLANLLFESGTTLKDVLGPFSFIGFFIAQLGEVLRMITPLVAALVGAGVVGSLSSRLGLIITERLSSSSVRILNFILVASAGAMLFAIVGAGIEWLYQINDPLTTFWIPAAIGALLGGILSLRYGPKDLVPIGSIIYLIMRTLLNAIRSIEPLIYVIIFVVWVGIGPFAGALALTLHTIAALAKLYSEQVECISPGPLEAVTATGANRLQTIIYAVVPQIIPPYISFTMYRWDINVRMSTIIGFAGGGGIGFLLQQNINLLDYRAAAVQMLAIAIVVASMDYTSALIRERFV
jgi:phosphonate ABC transporter permease subunit PhnE